MLNRRRFVGLLAAVPATGVAVPRFLNRRQYFGRMSFREYKAAGVFEPLEMVGAVDGIVLVDGREIKTVCYANTASGIVMTYDVLHDGRTAAGNPDIGGRIWKLSDFPGRDVECRDGVLIETLHGAVEIWGPVSGFAMSPSANRMRR